MSYLPHDTRPTLVFRNSVNNSTWPSGQILLEVYRMRTILAIMTAIAVLALGGITGGTFQAGHFYNSNQITAGENGSGG